ncbi:hypothetical protein VTK56DRAFT_8290 [Thermocarpiscus australiensis]
MYETSPTKNKPTTCTHSFSSPVRTLRPRSNIPSCVALARCPGYLSSLRPCIPTTQYIFPQNYTTEACWLSTSISTSHLASKPPQLSKHHDPARAVLLLRPDDGLVHPEPLAHTKRRIRAPRQHRRRNLLSQPHSRTLLETAYPRRTSHAHAHAHAQLHPH